MERLRSRGLPLRQSAATQFVALLPACPADEWIREFKHPMQITITVSDGMMREAQARGLSLQEFVESLIDKGLSASKDLPATQDRPVMSTAIERIRTLRSTAGGR
jgi:hypothetical protein